MNATRMISEGYKHFENYIKEYLFEKAPAKISPKLFDDEEIEGCRKYIISEMKKKSTNGRAFASEDEIKKMIDKYFFEAVEIHNTENQEICLSESFDWVEDATRNSVIDTKRDVYIAVSTSDSKKHVREAYRIHFRNGKYKNFEPHIKFAVREDRLYFASSSKEAGGYRLYGYDDQTKKSVFCSIKKTDRSSILQKFLGSHNLQYDKYTGYYFVQVEHSEG